jgi:hypothetical protein
VNQTPISNSNKTFKTLKTEPLSRRRNLNDLTMGCQQNVGRKKIYFKKENWKKLPPAIDLENSKKGATAPLVSQYKHTTE